MKYLSIIFTGIILSLLLISSKPDKKYYSEKYRPQFHFTPETGRQNAINGLVFYDGEYHIFYQYLSNNDDLQWGHAISENLVNWKHFPITFNSSDSENCRILSGSAVVDEKNILGKQKGNDKTFLMFYTGQNCGLKIAYSTNKGTTWENFERNPVLPHSDVRHPKVFWHEPTQKWVMILIREINNDEDTRGISIYSSSDLLNWEWKSHISGIEENPDLISLKVTNRPEETKWILFDGDGSYVIGDFDGEVFSPETDKIYGDNGNNYFAPQTWNNNPAEKGRIIQIALMTGGDFPDMPFSEQMTFPTELNITKLNTGYTLTRLPVKEIALLQDKHYKWTNRNLIPGIDDNPIKKIKGDSFRIIAEFDVKTSSNFGFVIRYGKKDLGTEILYNVVRETLSVLGHTVYIPLVDNKISFEILIDRASIEVFVNGGQVVFTNNFTPADKADRYFLDTNGGELFIKQMDIYAVKTSW